MKRITYILLTGVLAVSCYDKYVSDYDVQAVGFANPTDVRSVIVGESDGFSTGVALGGVISNEIDREVDFALDYTLVGDAVYNSFKSHRFGYISSLFKSVPSISALPAALYSIETPLAESGRTVIKAGEHVGTIRIKMAPEFFEDNANLLPRYVIPLRIVDGNGTAVMSGHETSVIGVRFECMLFGSWWHGGEMSVTDASGNELEHKYFRTEIPQSESLVWTLTSNGPRSVTANGVGDQLNSSKAQMQLSLGEDGTVTVSSVSGADYVVSPDGECRYNGARLLQDRKIYLKYKYEKDGKTCHVTDTLTFRNRIRDGVNEWQDENQEKY